MKQMNGHKHHEHDLPTIEMMAGEVVGQYRGQNRGQAWNYQYLRHIPVPQHPPQIRCRGVSDRVGKVEKTNVAVVETVEDEQTVSTVEPQNNIAQVHKTNLCDILERRRRVAEARGDEKLLHLLEVEWQYMVC